MIIVLTSFGYERISECGFAVIDVSDNRHVSNILGLVHTFPDFVNGKMYLKE